MTTSPAGFAARVVCLAAALLAAFATPPATAHPYASGLTNRSGTIYFVLNENAGDVSVIYGANAATNDLGPLSAGVNSFSLGYQGTNYTNYAIVVTKTGSGAVSQISVDSANNSIYGPRGVAVNRNPATHNFGRIYICNANSGQGVPAPGKYTTRGIFILNADTSDALGRGTNGSLGGITLGSNTTYEPYKPFVGPDDSVYIGACGADGTGGTAGGASVWKSDPDITNSVAILKYGLSTTNFGPCQSTPFVTGSLATGNLSLYCLMWQYPLPSGPYNNLYQYNIGGGSLPWTAAPVALGANAGNSVASGVLEDLYIAPDGKFFVTQDRNSSVGTGNISLHVFDSAGVNEIWNSSSAAGGVDPFVASYGVAVSPDDLYVAAIVNTSDNFFLLARLTNGLPDLSTLSTNATGIGTPGRGIAFDAADNVYVVSGGNDRLRVFSPGLNTIATTSNDSSATNGAFQFVVLSNTPSITSQPQSQTVALGASASFAVTASGYVPLTYQWQEAGTNLTDNGRFTGAHTNVLNISSVQAGDVGSYRVIVTNIYGAVTSTPATLSIQAPSFTNPWVQLANSPGPNNVRHDDVYFTDPTNGWASQNGFIYRTTNGGATWTTNLNLSGTHFRSLGFATPQVGFAGNLGKGSYDGGTTDTNVLYRTYDGGVTWSNVPGFAEAGMKGLCSIFVLDSKHIYGAGRVRGPAYFIKSEDGGTNWSLLSLTDMGVMNGIMDIYFQDPTNGWVVGMDTNAYAANCATPYYGRIARTTDGGNTWTPVVTTPIACSYFWKMAWPTPQIGYVSLQQNGSYNAIVFYKTTDGGNTWVSNGIPETSFGLSTNGFNFYLQGIGFVSANEGWIGGASGLPTYAPSFLHTTDGGVTWAPVGFNDSYFINRIRFLTPALGFASGANIYQYSVPLAIGQQPQSQVVVAGSNLNLSVTAYGAGPITYRWQQNGADVFSATNATLFLTNVTRSAAGTYDVIVTNSAASIQSSNAVVRVIASERLGPPILLPGDRLQLLFNDADGGALLTTNDLATFDVFASTNLVDWTIITNSLTLTNGSIIFEDTTTNYPARYYRVRER